MQKPPPPLPAAKPRKPKINLIKGVKSINQLALSYGKISALCKHPTRSVPGENIRGHGRRRRRRLRSIRFDTHQQRVLQHQPTTTEGNPLQARFIISSHVRTINLPSLPLPCRTVRLMVQKVCRRKSNFLRSQPVGCVTTKPKVGI